MRTLPCPTRLALGALALALATAPSPTRADATKVAEALRPFVEEGQLAGAVTLVASPDRVLAIDAVGYSDVADKEPMKADALFWIASMSKPITATALMMLVDEGKVGLDDPVSKYLPEFKEQWLAAERDEDHVLLKRPRHPITVREILSHTSGLPFASAMERPTLDLLPLRVGAASYAMTPLQSEPGTKYQYSNAGINTAGRIIEVASGVPYERFLDDRLFGPLGMKDTTFWPDESQLKRLAKSYKPGSGPGTLEEVPITQLKYPLDDRSRQPMPAGGLFSTAADVGIFCRMILNGGTLEGRRYVSESAVREMTSTQTGDLLNHGQGEGGYGLGWSTSRRAKGDDGPAIPGPCGHGGAYATNMSIDPGRRLVTVFMVQHAGFRGTDGGKINEVFKKAALDAFGRAAGP